MAESTTIRVSTETRDRLKALSARAGGSAGEIVAKLVATADEELLLADTEAAFEALARDPEALARYRAETRDIEVGFDTPAPAW
jgi:predicted DNA-binding protein